MANLPSIPPRSRPPTARSTTRWSRSAPRRARRFPALSCADESSAALPAHPGPRLLPQVRRPPGARRVPVRRAHRRAADRRRVRVVRSRRARARGRRSGHRDRAVAGARPGRPAVACAVRAGRAGADSHARVAEHPAGRPARRDHGLWQAGVRRDRRAVGLLPDVLGHQPGVRRRAPAGGASASIPARADRRTRVRRVDHRNADPEPRKGLVPGPLRGTRSIHHAHPRGPST